MEADRPTAQRIVCAFTLCVATVERGRNSVGDLVNGGFLNPKLTMGVFVRSS
jgi:hypothetical protein